MKLFRKNNKLFLSIGALCSGLITLPIASTCFLTSCSKSSSDKQSSDIKLTFDPKEGRITKGNSSICLSKGSKVSFGSLAKPTVEADNKIFAGWTVKDSSGKEVDITDNQVISSSLTFNANYVSNTSSTHKVITFKATDGVYLTGNTVVAVKKGHPFFSVNKPVATKSTTERTWFECWETSQGTKIVDSLPIEQDYELYPRFKDMPTLNESVYSITDQGLIIIWNIDSLASDLAITGYDFQTGKDITPVEREVFNYEIVIGKNVTTLPANFLAGCRRFNKNLTLPSTITSIGDHFMYNCNSFTSNLYVECPVSVFVGGNEQVCASAPTWTDPTFNDTHDSTIYTVGFNALGTYKTDFMSKFSSTGESSIYRKIVNQETHAHSISTSSQLEDITMSSSLPSVGWQEQFSLTVTSDRESSVTDASLTITVNGNTIAVPIEDIAPGTNTLTYTAKAVNDLFVAQGYSAMDDHDAISFDIVRVGAYYAAYNAETPGVIPNNKLYQIDIHGNKQPLTDTQLSDLSDGMFIVRDKDYDEFSVGTDFTSWFGSSLGGREYDIFLVKGSFYTGQERITTASTYKIHGITNSSNTLLASFQTYSETTYLGLSYSSLEIDHVNMLGRTGNLMSSFTANGIHCPSVICHDCYFTGSYTAWQHTEFYGCTFDSAKEESYYYEQEGGVTVCKNCYPLWAYGDYATTVIEGCTFLSGGKALKIYSDGALSSDKNHTIKNCTFSLDQSHAPAGYTVEVKSPIEIDATLFGSATTKFIIHNVTNSMSGYEGTITLINPKDTSTEHVHIDIVTE